MKPRTTKQLDTFAYNTIAIAIQLHRSSTGALRLDQAEGLFIIKLMFLARSDTNITEFNKRCPEHNY